jgi:DNA-binding NtrC family response regulator
MFGHVKGAFTDAQSDKAGYFEKAHGGTLFLDEIGETSLEIQVKLLRVLEDKTFCRMGSTTPIKLDAHLIFATNRNLEQAVVDGLFREDFYGRIKSHVIHIPPLRERTEEIVPLMAFFWDAQLKRKSSHPMYGKKMTACFSQEALKKMQRYSWPGNIRELRSTVEELVFESDFQEKNVIDLDLLPDRFHVSGITTVHTNAINDTILGIKAQHAVPDIQWTIAKRTAYQELAQIEKALIAANGRKDDVARMLGMKDDNALRYKVKTKYHNIFPELFDDFPVIKKLYKF